MNYSVLMSVYEKDNLLFLQKSVQSILNQTLKTNNFVIVKDGPLPTEISDFLNLIQSTNQGIIKLIQLNKNMGLGFALNYGLKHCVNNLVARMDSDDISILSRCEIQVNEFKLREKLVLLGGQVIEFIDDEKNGSPKKRVPIGFKNIYKYGKRRNPFNHPTVMFKKDIILNEGGYLTSRLNQDYDLFVRLIVKRYEVDNLSQNLLYFRFNTETLARRHNKENIKSHLLTVLSFRKMKYSSFFDYYYVLLGNLVLLWSPNWLKKIIYSLFLRR